MNRKLFLRPKSYHNCNAISLKFQVEDSDPFSEENEVQVDIRIKHAVIDITNYQDIKTIHEQLSEFIEQYEAECNRRK
jgi:hypothetical protein